MFLPADLTTSEQEFVATITTQLLAHRCPSTPAEQQAVRHEAAQVAAEMIYEARAASAPQEDPAETEPETGYHQRLRRTLEREREIAALEQAEMDGTDSDR
jgi:hypothetical protein